MEEQLKNWVKDFGRGTTDHRGYELKAFNDKFSLVNLKGKTAYIGRISPNAYSSSKWYVVENLSTVETSSWSQIPPALFSCEGRFTKEHQKTILDKFGITFVPEKKTKTKFEDKKLLFFDTDAFWGNGSFSSGIFLSELISEDEKGFTVFSKKEQRNKPINKNKYYTCVVDAASAASKGVELQQLVSDYNELNSKLLETKRKILDFMEKKV